MIITRRNDRRLRIGATDWVKNGDRWTIQDLTKQGVQAQHTQSGRLITLPSDYLESWTELGYACTTHTAQGVTADTCHGMLTGDETRQQAYTMLTRGRHANTAYLITVGDGDPHGLIHPDTINPATPPTSSNASSPATNHPSQPPPNYDRPPTRPSGSATPATATATPSSSPQDTSPATPTDTPSPSPPNASYPA